MLVKNILFDLDGTLTDSGEGIMNCAAYAMEKLGISVPPREALRVFVGPPLWDTFRDFGVPENQLDEAVSIFRSRYVPIGKFENVPYPGIPEMLETLCAEGKKLYVATSKPEKTALEILDHFQLSRYFSRICGASEDLSRSSKEDVIAYLLRTDANRENSVMVGDTKFDVLGAAAHGIPTIGVSWGYGSTEEMLASGATAIVDTPQALLQEIEASGF